MFNDLLSELTKNILEHGGKELIVPNEFCECVSKQGNCKLNSWLWDVPGFRRWRVTRLDAGDRLEVLNSVAYPNEQNDMPIMGIDLLWFEKKEKLFHRGKITFLVTNFTPSSENLRGSPLTTGELIR